MSRVGLRGPRRTRVYESNYNAGEKYYRPALDNIDRKYYGKPLFSERAPSPSPKFSYLNSDSYPEEPLQTSRRRAERAITEETFFDSRGSRIPRSSLGVGFANDDINEDIHSKLTQLRASKKSSHFSNDVDFEDAVDSVRRRRAELAEKLNSFGDNNNNEVVKRSTLKVTTRRQEEDVAEPLSITKWSAVSSVAEDTNSGASLRARATKARLEDLEDEMTERTAKQLAREKRSAQLKQFLAESDIETAQSSSKHVAF